MHKNGEQVTPVEARAGFLDRPVLMILIASSAIAALSLFATGILSF
jgi:hypothetical protein